MAQLAEYESFPTNYSAKRKDNEKRKSLNGPAKDNKEKQPMHWYPLRVSKRDVDITRTHQWLKRLGLKAETERLITAAKD